MRRDPADVAKPKGGLAAALAVLVAVFLVAGVAVEGASAAKGDREVIPVSNTEPVSVTSQTVLDPSHAYRLIAHDRISDWPDAPEDGFGVDAVWCYAVWRCGTEGLQWRQLRVKRAAEDWGPTWGQGLDEFAGEDLSYKESHVYKVEVSGVEGRLEFATWDAFVLNSHTGNKGSFTVTIVDLGPAGQKVDVAFNVFVRNSRSFTKRRRGPNTLRGKDLSFNRRLTPVRPITIRHVDFRLIGSPRLLRPRVLAGKKFSDFRNADGGRTTHLLLVVKVVRSNDPKCPVGRRGSMRLFDIDYPAGLLRERRSAVVMQLCKNHRHDQAASDDDLVAIAPYTNLRPSERPPRP